MKGQYYIFQVLIIHIIIVVIFHIVTSTAITAKPPVHQQICSKLPAVKMETAGTNGDSAVKSSHNLPFEDINILGYH